MTVITSYNREVITGYHRAVTFTAWLRHRLRQKALRSFQQHAGGATLSSSALARSTATKHQGSVLSARRSLPRPGLEVREAASGDRVLPSNLLLIIFL